MIRLSVGPIPDRLGGTLASVDYQQVRDNLRRAYDGAADRRDRQDKEPWKLAERTGFLRRLQKANCTRILEIGAGTGQDSVFFASHGLDVVATDMSAAMVARCRDKGLDARVIDFSQLDFPAGSFDAVYAMNCLLVPNAELPAVLASIARVLRPGGLFFLGVYGGSEGTEEGSAEWDDHVPARFFSWRTDDQIVQFASESFDIIDFHIAQAGTQHRFQSLTLRRYEMSQLGSFKFSERGREPGAVGEVHYLRGHQPGPAHSDSPPAPQIIPDLHRHPAATPPGVYRA